jgi:hypothetical protein
MKNKVQSNPNNYYVVLKRDGIVIEFKRDTKKKPQPFLSYATAKRAWDKVRASHQDGGEWFLETTYRLATNHRKEWERARV